VPKQCPSLDGICTKEGNVATLRQKSNGYYFVDYRINGRRVRKVLGRVKKLAELAAKEIEIKLERGQLGLDAPKDTDLAKLFQEYRKYSLTRHAPASQKRYRGIIDNFNRFLKEYPFISKISQLNPKIFTDYQSWRKNQKAANKTINTELVCLKGIFNVAVEWKFCRESPAKGVDDLKIDINKAPAFFTKDQCKKILDNSDDFMRPILYTFLHTGMRKAELENLEWADVDFERKKLKIRYKDNWQPKTSERQIPINNGLIDVLLSQKKKEVDGCTYLFHRDGEKIDPNFLRRRFMQLTKLCGFGHMTCIHTLRHTFASHLVMGGVDLPTVQKLMGHSNIATTMIYSHLADEHVDRAVEKLNF
jgi:site-specific recombinase XerD